MSVTIVLFLVALLAQSADAAMTCRNLAHGHVELNRLAGRTCGQVVWIKGAALGTVVVLLPVHRRAGFSMLAVSGGVGIGITLALK